MSRELSSKTRWLVLCVGVALAGVYFLPLWSIRLVAPQYPEGMGMYIWAGKITGHAEFDLKNINLLNHYVGMDPIVEQAIPEFQYMPYILAYMILGAFVTFFYPRRFMVGLGLVNLALVGLAGFYDFWRWEYNYGHNLNPEAPISIPGMVYQPPMIGCKQLLNITSCSWPHAGGIVLMAVGLILFATACSRSRPVDFAPGEYSCDLCRMNITDMRFKTEAITRKGKILHFDSLECLFSWSQLHGGEWVSRWVTDLRHPEKWVPFDKAFILKSERLASPMGENLSAYSSQEDFDRALREFGGAAFSPENPK